MLIELNGIAKKNKIQIVCTSHRESLISLSNLINIRQLYEKNGDTHLLENSTPDVIDRMTGEKTSPIEIYVEDDLSSAVISKICAMEGISKYIKIVRFGAAKNCFTILGSELMKGNDVDLTLYVLDGDVHETDEEKIKMLRRAIDGDDNRFKDLRDKSLSYIAQYNPPNKESPEEFISMTIKIIDKNYCEGANNEEKEIIDAINKIIYDKDKHNYIDLVVKELGGSREIVWSRIIELLIVAKRDKWNSYVYDVRERIMKMREALE